MPKRTLMLVLVVLAVACGDQMTAPAPEVLPRYGLLDLAGFWKDSYSFFNAPPDFTGLTDHPVNGCSGQGVSRVTFDESLLKIVSDTAMTIQMNQGLGCPHAEWNSFSWMLSFITRRAPSFGYPITVAGDTMLFVGTFSDSNHLSGKIVLAIAKTQVGTWSRERLVPTSQVELVKLSREFDSSTKNMPLGSYKIVRTGRYALP